MLDRGKSSNGSSSGGGGGNKVCFIFTIPPAKYRPVFPRDIDISGVPGLLLLTPFLHWLGIYVFFLLSSFHPSFSLFFSSTPSSPFHISASPSRCYPPPSPRVRSFILALSLCSPFSLLLSIPSFCLVNGRYLAASPPPCTP